MARRINTLEDLEGLYGQEFTQGIISENLDLVERLGGHVHTVASGRQYVAPVAGGRAIPVLCSEVVAIYTEDGRISGRCGLPALAPEGACQAHGEILAAWRAQGEAETKAWERDIEAMAR